MSVICITLGTAVQRARKMHRCDNCEHDICPGDVYSRTGQLLTYGNLRIVRVRKEHEQPWCPYPEDDPDFVTVFVSNVYHLPLAA